MGPCVILPRNLSVVAMQCHLLFHCAAGAEVSLQLTELLPASSKFLRGCLLRLPSPSFLVGGLGRCLVGSPSVLGLGFFACLGVFWWVVACLGVGGHFGICRRRRHPRY